MNPVSRIYTLYAAGSATANAAASVQILQNTRIKSVRWAVNINSITDDGVFYGELSLLNASQQTQNESMGIVSVVRGQTNFLTSGIFWGGIKCQDFVDCPLQLQQILYFNTVISGTLTYQLTIQVDCTA